MWHLTILLDCPCVPPSSLPRPSLCPSGLVEKAPCSSNSSRLCECQPGMYCQTPAINSCARCVAHSRCPGGKVVKFPGECPHLSLAQVQLLLYLPQPPPQCSPPPPWGRQVKAPPKHCDVPSTQGFCGSQLYPIRGTQLAEAQA